MYYERSDDGVPHAFVKVSKTAIKSVAPAFSTRRMVKEYVNLFYASALGMNEAYMEVCISEAGQELLAGFLPACPGDC